MLAVLKWLKLVQSCGRHRQIGFSEFEIKARDPALSMRQPCTLLLELHEPRQSVLQVDVLLHNCWPTFLTDFCALSTMHCNSSSSGRMKTTAK